MRYLVTCVALVTCSMLAITALAQDAKKEEKKNEKRAEMKERLLKEFDANNDGKLDDQERQKAKEKMREMRAARAKGGKKAARGPQAAAERPPMPNPEEM